MFTVLKTGKTKRKGWKRMVTKATFVGEDFTRKPPKLERFIRPSALRYKKANVTHRALLSWSLETFIVCFRTHQVQNFPTAELKATFQLPIIGVKKNPQSPMVIILPPAVLWILSHLLMIESRSQYTQLGVMTKGTIIEVNVSELGLVTTGGKVVWGKYAQITNNPVS